MSHLPHCKATSSFQPYAATMTRDYSRNQGLIPVLCRMYAATVVNSKKEREDLRPCLFGRRSKEGSCRERVYPRLGFSFPSSDPCCERSSHACSTYFCSLTVVLDHGWACSGDAAFRAGYRDVIDEVFWNELVPRLL